MPSTLCHRCHQTFKGSRCECRQAFKEATYRKTGERGYDQQWRKLSEYKRKINPLCERCEDDNRVEPATQVHHVVPISVDPSLRLEITNLMSLCDACHEAVHGKGRET